MSVYYTKLGPSSYYHSRYNRWIRQNETTRQVSVRKTKMTLEHTKLRDYLFTVFKLNEKLAEDYDNSSDPEDLPVTDEELELIVAKHFIDAPNVLASLEKTSSFVNSRIRVWRSEYNRGLWSQKPVYRSFRYGPDGKPINSYANPLTATNVAVLIRNFEFPDPRKPEAELFLAKEGAQDASTESKL